MQLFQRLFAMTELALFWLNPVDLTPMLFCTCFSLVWSPHHYLPQNTSSLLGNGAILRNEMANQIKTANQNTQIY
jgi:hypothetical protein